MRYCSMKHSTLPPIKLAASYDTAETVLDDKGGHECPICMECFKQNDLVSWSPSTDCDHVFHHACIKTWLLYHECCPYCRVTVLTVDNDTSFEINSPSSSVATIVPSPMLGRFGFTKKRLPRKKDNLLQLMQQRHQRSCSTYYCLKEGLVLLDCPPATKEATTKEGKCAESGNKATSLCALKRHVVSNVHLSEMIALRTHPKCTANGVAVTINAATHENASTATSINGNAAQSHQQALQFADAIIDIEMSMTELRVVSNDSPALDDGEQ
jgi:Ring finger domain